MFARASLVEKRRIERLTVFRAELEDVADFNRAANLQWLGALCTRLTRADGAQIKPRRHLDVAFDRDVLQMETVLVRTSRHVIRTLQTLVGVDFKIIKA